MFNKKKQPPIKSLIAEGTQIEGNVAFSEGLRVDGAIIGNVLASDGGASILVISDSARSEPDSDFFPSPLPSGWIVTVFFRSGTKYFLATAWISSGVTF